MSEPIKAVLNDIKIHINEAEGLCSLIVNGVEIAGMIERGMRLETGLDEGGEHAARLTVTYPVMLP